MTKLEQRMYQILGAVSATDAPIVFVGGLITKLILAENDFSLDRPTVDIDANWTGAPPSMDGLVRAVNQSLEVFDGELVAQAKREYDDQQTAGLSIVETATGSVVISMDIDIRPVSGSRIYYYGEMEIRGVLPTEILADKVSVLSSRYIFRRAKDMVDVYALAHCVRASTSEIYDVHRMKGSELGAFFEFYSRRQDVEHAYERLRGISGKPAFAEIHAYLEKFVSPFAQKDEAPRLWNTGTSEWEDARASAT
jgi:hypothetical protein